MLTLDMLNLACYNQNMLSSAYFDLEVQSCLISCSGSTPKQDYAFHLDIVRNNLRPAEQDSLDKALEFTAIQAFLLGLRTGEGLAYSRRVSRGSYL